MATYADKVPGGKPYYYNSSYYYGYKSDTLGYGRININNYILGIYNISGPSNYCSSTDQQYYFSNLPNYFTVAWSSSNPNMPVNANTGLLSNVGGSPNETILTATVSNICTVVSRYIVQGGFGREVYILEQDNAYGNVNSSFAGGDDPNYSLRVPSNYSGGSVPISMAVGYGPSKNKSVVLHHCNHRFHSI